VVNKAAALLSTSLTGKADWPLLNNQQPLLGCGYLLSVLNSQHAGMVDRPARIGLLMMIVPANPERCPVPDYPTH